MADALKGPVKAAAGAAFLVGLVLLLLNPPSMSGAAGLAMIVVGAVGLTALAAWGAVALTGRHAMSEQEVERLVQRSERLARQPPPEREPDEFDHLVAEAIDELPDEFRELLEKVPVIVSYEGAEHHAYGRYHGDGVARDSYPDRIVLYRDTLERDFGWDPERLRAEVARTLRHELAHHLGWHERGVRELGL